MHGDTRTHESRMQQLECDMCDVKANVQGAAARRSDESGGAAETSKHTFSLTSWLPYTEYHGTTRPAAGPCEGIGSTLLAGHKLDCQMRLWL
eukprot:2078690-Pleurochrysis_carterae.AAC.3